MPDKHINPKLNRALGQNFLKRDAIAQRIVESLALEQGSLVIEIGVGSGKLTRALCEKGYRVIGYEIDERFILGNRNLESPGCKLIYSDFLKAELGELPSGISYVANIPYYITSPIIEKIMFEGPTFSKAVLMVQKEYADRLTSPPGNKEYGVLSVNVNTFARVRKLFEVSKEEFIPRPEVDSSVIELTLREDPPIDPNDRDAYRVFVRRCFAQRRKKLKNNLKGLLNDPESFLNESDVDPQARAETLSIEDFVRLFENLNLKDGGSVDGKIR